MLHKHFAEKLNRELDNIGFPQLEHERIEAFSKLLKIPKFKAEVILNGTMLPDKELSERIATELEIDASSLHAH